VAAVLVVAACSGAAPGPRGAGGPRVGPGAGEASLPRERQAVELVVEGPFACARSGDGRVACWSVDIRMEPSPSCSGRPGERCPFEPRVAGLTAPAWVRGLSGARSIALGGYGGAVRDDGSVVVWAVQGPTALAARQVEGLPPAGASQLALGLMTGCAACGSGDVWCWGDPRRFRTIDEPGWAAAARREVLSEVIHLDADFDTFCAVTAAGSVACWGDNQGAVLGPAAGPVQVSIEAVAVPGLDDALEVATDRALTCVRRQGGAVSCWGSASPTSGLDAVGDVDAIALGPGRGCAVRRDGGVACWGQGAVTPEVAGLAGVADLSIAADHACAVRRDGTVACWGEGGEGQLGQGVAASSAAPVVVAGVGDALEVAAGQLTCALRRGGRIACWGQGVGPTPVEVLLPASRPGDPPSAA
jgi:hypothetical protein